MAKTVVFVREVLYIIQAYLSAERADLLENGRGFMLYKKEISNSETQTNVTGGFYHGMV